MRIEPDIKDWTWVLERPCPDCGFDPAGVRRDDIGPRVRANGALWPPLLAAPTAAQRPAPTRWSVLEYACHVRDVHRVFVERLALLLERDDPLFANWDQDVTAAEGRYAEQEPAAVADELVTAAEQAARAWDDVPPDAWERRGRRSNGSIFAVETLGRYQLHDLDHHAWDVREAPAPPATAPRP